MVECAYCGAQRGNIRIMNGNSCCYNCRHSKKIDIRMDNPDKIIQLVEISETLLEEIQQLKEKVERLEKKLHRKHHKSSSRKKSSELTMPESANDKPNS